MAGVAGALILLAVAGTAPPVTGQTARAPRIGFLSTASAAAAAPRVDAFRLGLRELGYIEGTNLSIEYRWAEGKDDRLPALAADLVARKVDVIVTQGTVPTLAARKATRSIPIVMATAGDPVATGLAASLARPGGNITGLTQINPEVAGKRLELLREFLPRLTRLGVLWNPGNPVAQPELRETEAAARALGLALVVVGVQDPDALSNAVASMKQEQVGALLVLSDIMFFGRRRHLGELAANHGLPAVAWTRELADSGLLMTYGADTIDMHRRAAGYVDRILKGANAGDLPIQQPGTFELAINLKTGRALGITIPAAVRLRANHVIE